MNGTDNEVQIGSGTSPDGAAVSYYKVDRPGTIGAQGSTGIIIEVRGAGGKRITHSDSLAGLKKAGYKVDDVTKTPGPAPVVLRKDVAATPAEAEALATFRGQLDAEQAAEFDKLLADYAGKPLRPVAEILGELDEFFPLTSAQGAEPTRVPVPKDLSAEEIEKQL
jgi:hypothetical protein